MKKIIFIFGLLFVTIGVLNAQEIPDPTNILDVITKLDVYLGSLAGLAVISAFFAAMLNGVLKVTKKFVKQLVAWGVSIIIIVAADLLNYGFAADFPIFKAIYYGFAAGLVANGMFDIPFVKAILDKVDGWFKPKE
jgi:hypothetical protein